MPANRPGKAEGDEANRAGVVADEGGALRIVAHGIADAAERRARDRVHRPDRHEAPGRDEVVDLRLRAEAVAEEARHLRAVGGDAFLAAEEAAQDERAGHDEFADAQRDHGERGAGPLRRHGAEQHAEEQSAEGTHYGEQRQRHRPAAGARHVEQVDGDEAAETEEHGVTEGQEPRLPEQHVVGQGEDDHRPHQAHRRQRQPRAEQVGQQDQDRGQHDPDRVAGQKTRPAAGCLAGTIDGARPAHVSRVPMRPRGRKIRISTRSR